MWTLAVQAQFVTPPASGNSGGSASGEAGSKAAIQKPWRIKKPQD